MSYITVKTLFETPLKFLDYKLVAILDCDTILCYKIHESEVLPWMGDECGSSP